MNDTLEQRDAGGEPQAVVRAGRGRVGMLAAFAAMAAVGGAEAVGHAPLAGRSTREETEARRSVSRGSAATQDARITAAKSKRERKAKKRLASPVPDTQKKQ